MLNELQKRKMTRLFHVFDADNNGLREENDSVIVCKNLAKIRGWSEDTSEYKALLAAFMHSWKRMIAETKTVNEGQVTLDEFLAHQESLFRNPEEVEKAIEIMVDNLLQVFDANRDNKLQYTEFCSFYEAYGLGEELAKEIFPQLLSAHEDYLTREEVHELGKQFYLSQTPDAPGNLLFGPY